MCETLSLLSSDNNPHSQSVKSQIISFAMNTALDELQWKSPEWIQAFGLRTDNILDYFAESPFFNKTANNQVIKMQRQFSQMPDAAQTESQDNNQQHSVHNGDTSGVNTSNSHQQKEQNEFTYLEPIRRDLLSKYPMHAMLERELSRMKGIEYVLGYVREPDFWVIKKQNRKAPNQVECLQDYYIIGANVYQSPTIFKIVQSRLMSATYHLSTTLNQLHKLTDFQPSQGVQFKRIQSMGPGNHGNTIATNGAGAISSNNSAPPTATTNGQLSAVATVATAQTGSISQIDNNGANDSQHVITKEMMQKLMFISVKSTPEYV